MIDKVQKIKDWISREQDGLMDVQGNFEYPEHQGAYNVLCNLDAYIDSLQEEPISKDFEMALAEMVDKAQRCVVEPWVVAAQWKDELIKLAKSEEPVSEELEEAATQYGIDNFPSLCNGCKHVPVDAFKAGAKWQKEQIMKDSTDVTVHIDAGGYPYIPQMELYDYDKDMPLAKKGDKVKVIVIKEN